MITRYECGEKPLGWKGVCEYDDLLERYRWCQDGRVTRAWSHMTLQKLSQHLSSGWWVPVTPPELMLPEGL